MMRQLLIVILLPLIVVLSAEDTAPERSLLDAVIAHTRILEPELDEEQIRVELATLVARCRRSLVKATTAAEKVAALNRVVLSERQTTYLSNKYWRDASLTAALIRNKGNCLATSTLYVVLGEQLDLPIHMVIVPAHAYVCWHSGEDRINIETTAGGRAIPSDRYISRPPRPLADEIARYRYNQPLNRHEFEAEIMKVAAGHLAGQNKIDDAIAMVDKVATLVPNRLDYRLWRYQLQANLPGQRSQANQAIWKLITDEDCPVGLQVGGLLHLADDAGGHGDHERKRRLLLQAFKIAPKTRQTVVLQQLAFCHRALKDYRGAVRYMELAIVLHDQQSPTYPGALYNLAILLKNDGRLPEAIARIRQARKLNPESWNLQMIEAGYLVLAGKRDEGLALRETIQKPRAQHEFWEIMVAWFYAVSEQREPFYQQFTRLLATAKTESVLNWIDEDVDLDVYRSEAAFQKLVKQARKRIMGSTAQAPASTPVAVP